MSIPPHIKPDSRAETLEGKTLVREEEFGWQWVLRNDKGEVVDKDRYRHDLAERNGLTLAAPATLPNMSGPSKFHTLAALRNQQDLSKFDLCHAKPGACGWDYTPVAVGVAEDHAEELAHRWLMHHEMSPVVGPLMNSFAHGNGLARWNHLVERSRSIVGHEAVYGKPEALHLVELVETAPGIAELTDVRGAERRIIATGVPLAHAEELAYRSNSHPALIGALRELHALDQAYVRKEPPSKEALNAALARVQAVLDSVSRTPPVDPDRAALRGACSPPAIEPAQKKSDVERSPTL